MKRTRCKDCEFWIEQNADLIKINAVLGERVMKLDKICGEMQYGSLAQVLSLLSSEQIDEVKTFAEYLLSKGVGFNEKVRISSFDTNRQAE